MSNQGKAKEIPLHQIKSQSVLYKRIQLLEEENAALLHALKTLRDRVASEWLLPETCRVVSGIIERTEKGKGK